MIRTAFFSLLSTREVLKLTKVLLGEGVRGIIFFVVHLEHAFLLASQFQELQLPLWQSPHCHSRRDEVLTKQCS